MSKEDLISVDYEIFGRVQGVFFRKYTQGFTHRVLWSLQPHLTVLRIECHYSVMDDDKNRQRHEMLLKAHVKPAEGRKLGLVGWVQNTSAGTVQGQLQGPHSKVQEMQEWLKSTGSPKSHITKAEFRNEKTIDSLEHSTFNIVK